MARSRAVVTEALADGGLDHLGRFTTPDGESPSLRRIVIDLIEEYARHVGHADLIRESVDGLTGEDPTDSPYPYRHVPALTDRGGRDASVEAVAATGRALRGSSVRDARAGSAAVPAARVGDAVDYFWRNEAGAGGRSGRDGRAPSGIHGRGRFRASRAREAR